jgi:hypothetical protein
VVIGSMWGTSGSIIGGLIIAIIVYAAGKCWYDWFGWPDSWDD